MTWLTTHNSVNIQDFRDAEYHYEQFQPIRGRSKEETGAALMSRRDWRHKSLHKLDDDTYGFRLYDTDVVQIHRDHSITLDLTYPSQTTNAWAEHYLRMIVGRWITVNSEHGMISVPVGIVNDDTLKQYHHEVKESEQRDWLYFFSDDRKFRIEPHYRKRWAKVFVKDPDVRYVKRVDKSGANESRKPLQPFLNYLKIFESSPLPATAISEMMKEGREKYGSGSWSRLLVERPDDQELWAYVAADLHRHNYDWRSQSHNSELLPMKEIKTQMYQLKYEFDGLHGFNPLPIGVCKNTRLYSQFDVDRANV